MKVETEMEEQFGNTGAAAEALERTNPVGRALAAGTGLYPRHCQELPRSRLCSPTGAMKGSAREEVGQAGGRRAGFMRGA